MSESKVEIKQQGRTESSRRHAKPTAGDTAQSPSRSPLRRLTPQSKLPSASVVRNFSEEDLEILNRVLSEPAECIYDASFRRKSAENALMSPLPDMYIPTIRFDDEESVLSRAVRRAPSATFRTLNGNEERDFFLRFNFCRSKVMQVLREFEGKRLTAQAARDLVRWEKAARETRDLLIEANLGLVPTMVRRAKIVGADMGELISEGQMALLRSVDRFDCMRGFKFSTYACRAIWTALTRFLSSSSRYRSHFPTEFDPDFQKSDRLERVRESIENDCVAALQEILDRNGADLSDMEKRVLRERFGVANQTVEGEPPRQKTLRQVAAVFGVTKERVRQIQNKALAKLRGAIEERVFAA